MNWSFILLQIVVFIGLISIMIAAVYYIRHRHTKAVGVQQQLAAGSVVDGGELLKRYIPPEHRKSGELVVKSLFASRPLFYISCLLIPCLFIGFISLSYYTNRNQFLDDIVLSKHEIDKLTARTYRFESSLDQYAIAPRKVSQAIDDAQNFVVMAARYEGNYVPEGWMKYLKRNRFKAELCEYESLSECSISKNTTVIFSLAEAPSSLLPVLTDAGVNVLAFGFPDEIESISNSIPGLTFEHQKDAKVEHFAVVGDRELTLGLDAGTNFALARIGRGVVARSVNPQAIAMYTDGIAGGDIDARMHATTLGKSRIVWIDFAITEGEFMENPQQQLFDSAVAGVLRFLTHQTYSSIASWPFGKKYAAFFEEDTEDGYVFAERVATFFGEKKIPLTWYVLSDLANDHRGVTRRLAEAGEMACHGDNHDIMTRYSQQGQTERLARCIKVVEAITGKRPTGFRPPTEVHNDDTYSALVNVGMTHLFAENSGATQVPHIKSTIGSDKYIVSFPRAISDDFYMWNYLKLSAEKSVERMQDELRWIRSAGTLFGFSFHTQFMQQDDLFGVVKTLASVISTDESAYLDTVGGLTDWWLVRHKLMTGKEITSDQRSRYSPVLLTVGSDGQLTSMLATHPLSASPIVIASEE